MRERENRDQRIHGRVWELLPWFVNDTLSERERERVEAHLADCPRCQEEERTCRRTAEAVKSAGEVAPSPHPVQFKRMLSRIEDFENAQREERVRGGWGRLGIPRRSLLSTSGATPGRLRTVLVAQAAVILLLIGVVGWKVARPRPTAPAFYRTLSDPAPVPAPSVRLRVLFSPRTTEREIRELLLSVRGEITAGPSPLGVYTLAVPAERDSAEVVVARLRSEPQVAFAERATGGEPEKQGR